MSEKPTDDDEQSYPMSPESTQRYLAEHQGAPLITDDDRRADLSPEDLDVSVPWPTHQDRPSPSDADQDADGD